MDKMQGQAHSRYEDRPFTVKGIEVSTDRENWRLASDLEQMVAVLETIKGSA